MSMEQEILGDTDLETIINEFASKKCNVMKLSTAELFQRAHITLTESSFPSILRNLKPMQSKHNAQA